MSEELKHIIACMHLEEMSLKGKIVLAIFIIAWMIVLLSWVCSIKAIKDAYSPSRIYATYTVISGIALLCFAFLMIPDGKKLCNVGLHDWVVWKDRDGYPDMKRVCVDCGRIQELLYNMLDFDWSDV